jgi:hypothetical protein
MRKRLYNAIGALLGCIFILALLCSAPIWIIIWVITGFDPIDALRKVFDPKAHARIDTIKKETEEIRAEIERLERELEETEKNKEDFDRIKRSN